MINIWLYSIISVIAVSLISLVGAVTLFLNDKLLRKIVFVLVAVSVGALFGDVFLHMLPEFFSETQNASFSSFLVLVGILIFFVLEKFLLWRHSHGVGASDHEHVESPVGTMVLLSDALHNFVDGIVIAASYLVSIPIGVATTLAVVLHEIPQEIGNFGVLLAAGYERKKALLYNLISALTAIVGTVIMLLANEKVGVLSLYIVPIAAGGFIYIAGSDLVPELRKMSDTRSSLIQFISIGAGILLMLALTFLE